MRRAEGARELMEGPLSEADLTASLADLDRLNRCFGGYALTLAHIRRVAATVPRSREMIGVAVGGGRGDVAVRRVRGARRAGRRGRGIGGPPHAAGLARGRRPAYPEIVAVAGDATALPLREGAADIVVAALTLHHLDRDAAAACLSPMRAAAPLAVVNDLLRSRTSSRTAWETSSARPHRPSIGS